MIIAKESLKLPICPLCKKPKDRSPKLLAIPIYECSDCKIEWTEWGIREIDTNEKMHIIDANGVKKIV